MKRSAYKYFIFIWSVFLICATTLYGYAEGNINPDPQTISKTGLLPVYGVDFAFDPSWVDGERFPSRSANHPHLGVNVAFQDVWEVLKRSGFNVIRFPVDVSDAQSAVNRFVNLCLWAKNNNVKLVPVLVGAQRKQALGSDYPINISAFIKGVIAALRGSDERSLDAYAQILAYQLENEMNHIGLHAAMPTQSAQQRLVEAVRELRKAEQETLKESGLNATPLMVNASFDYELIKARAIAGTTLSDDAYARSYEALKQFLAGLAASPDIDVIGVDWFAGSLSAGGVERFPALLRTLMADLAGKQIVFTTGYSTGFRSAEEQQKFYALAFANLADFRASEGVDTRFTGVFFHEAVSVKERNPAPPRRGIESEVAMWDWPAKADELARMWSGQGASDSMAWWLKRVENNFGLVYLPPPNVGTASVIAQPAQEGLRQIANTVSEANQTVASSNLSPLPEAGVLGTAGGLPSNPTFRKALMDKAQQGLMLVLDHVFGLVGDVISRKTRSGGSGFGIGNTGGNIGGIPGDINTGGVNTIGGDVAGGNVGGITPGGIATASVMLASGGVSFQPANPRIGEPVTFNVMMRNKSPNVDASGLVVALLDDASNVLAQVSDVAITHNATQNVTLQWMPPEPKTYRVSMVVADANLALLASAPLDPLTVAATLPVNIPPGGVSSPRISRHMKIALPLGSPQVDNLNVGTPGQSLTEGQSSSLTLSMTNPYPRPLTNIRATLVLDGKPEQTRTVGSLLPRQSRSVLFTNVRPLQAGTHEVMVMLESQGAKLQRGSVTSQIRVNPNMSHIPVRAHQPTAIPSVGSSPTSPVRPILPPRINVGKLAIPMTGDSGSATASASAKSTGSSAASAGEPGSSTTPARPAMPNLDRTTSATKSSSVGIITHDRPSSNVLEDKHIEKPNLIVRANEIRYGPTAPRAGEALAFIVPVRNIGKGEAKHAKVICTLYADGRMAASQEFTSDIKANGLYPVRWNVRTPSARTLRFEVLATVAEDAEPRNNRAIIDINVTSSRPLPHPPGGLPRPVPRKRPGGSVSINGSKFDSSSGASNMLT